MKKVVIINNDPDFQFLVKSFLERKGFDTVNINIDEPVIKRLQNYTPDVIILDINAERDAQICSQLVQIDTVKNSKLIILTDQSIDISRLPCKADAVLMKPFQPQELVNKLSMIM